MMITTIFESGLIVPTNEKLSCGGYVLTMRNIYLQWKKKISVPQETQDLAQSLQRPTPAQI